MMDYARYSRSESDDEERVPVDFDEILKRTARLRYDLNCRLMTAVMSEVPIPKEKFDPDLENCRLEGLQTKVRNLTSAKVALDDEIVETEQRFQEKKRKMLEEAVSFQTMLGKYQKPFGEGYYYAKFLTQNLHDRCQRREEKNFLRNQNELGGEDEDILALAVEKAGVPYLQLEDDPNMQPDEEQNNSGHEHDDIGGMNKYVEGVMKNAHVEDNMMYNNTEMKFDDAMSLEAFNQDTFLQDALNIESALNPTISDLNASEYDACIQDIQQLN